MTFSRKSRPSQAVYTLGDAEVTRIFNIRDLGVTFDCRLTFHEHISLVAAESYRRLGFVLRNARDFRNPNIIKILYNSLVRSKL